MTNIQKRRMAMMNSVKRGRLPSGYQEVTHIESTGTQWIDTNAYGDIDTKVDLTVKLSNTTNAYAIFGSSLGDNDRSFMMRSTNARTSIYACFDTITRTGIQAVPYDTNIKHLILSRDGYYNNDTLCATWNNPHDFTTPNTLEICRIIIHRNALPMQGYIYYCKLWEAGVLIRDFVPCYRKSDGVIGMYDLCGTICSLTNTPFYINAGTGTFLKGADVL